MGVYITIHGNEKTQEGYLKEKTREFDEQIRSSQYNPNTIMYTYNSCFLKRIKYSNIVLNFEGKKWTEIIVLDLEGTLNRSAIAAKFLWNVLYRPTLYKGLDIQHHYYKQSTTKMKTYISMNVQ